MWVQIGAGIAVGALVGRSPKESALLTGATIGTSGLIRRIGIMRVAQSGWFAVRAIGAMSIQGFTAGVVGGALVGTGISYLLFGEEGAKAAVDFYTDPFDLDKAKTISDIPSNIAAITQGNRAVENNALGLPTGTNVSTSYTAPGHEAFHSTGSAIGDENIQYW